MSGADLSGKRNPHLRIIWDKKIVPFGKREKVHSKSLYWSPVKTEKFSFRKSSMTRR